MWTWRKPSSKAQAAHLQFSCCAAAIATVCPLFMPVLLEVSDGVTNSGPLNEDLSKVLKKLGYPEVHDTSKPSTLIDKAVQACTRRLKKLFEMLPARETDASATPATPSSSSDLQERPFSQHTVCYICNVSSIVTPLLINLFCAQDVRQDPGFIHPVGCLLRKVAAVQG